MKNLVKASKKKLTQRREDFLSRSQQGESIQSLIDDWCSLNEDILLTCWTSVQLDKTSGIALLALGSFARGELLPYSDIDILILTATESYINKKPLEKFIQLLWDIGFTVGHQITTVNDLYQHCKQDPIALTSLLEMKMLCGQAELVEELTYISRPFNIWPHKAFFNAKYLEQRERHKKYSKTAYNLEPDIKSGPGGSRDLQIIFWLAGRLFNTPTSQALRKIGVATPKEIYALNECYNFLLEVRFLLHLVSKKNENRLLFTYQHPLAEHFNIHHISKEVAVTNFMKQYYQISKKVRSLNDLFLQLFREKLPPPKEFQQCLETGFLVAKDHIEIGNAATFKRKPLSMFKLFFALGEMEEPKYIGSKTIRAIQQYRDGINRQFRSQPQSTQYFIHILKNSHNIYFVLSSLHKYGLLHRYIPQFGLIAGQMQYDLFHIYTVDQHSLFVLKNIQAFSSEGSPFDLCHEIYHRISDKYCLYIAALFHDIGKGRGGDHSEIGETDVIHFCQQHHLDSKDIDTISTLVRQHLLLSLTAQRKDIDDPKTIIDFCSIITSQLLLDLLYLLTVADICATNPKLWNGWKDNLLKRLYFKAKAYLDASSNHQENEGVLEKKQRAMHELSKSFSSEDITSIWSTFGEKYFSQEDHQMIIQQTQGILSANEYPMVVVSMCNKNSYLDVFFYGLNASERIHIVATILNNFSMTIVEAKLYDCLNEFALDTYKVLSHSSNPPSQKKLHQAIQNTIINHLTPPIRYPKPVQRLQPQRSRLKPFKPEISFFCDERNQYDVLVLKATDRNGLLANVSKILTLCQVQIHAAKIHTSGDQVEDTFFISSQGKPLKSAHKSAISQQLINYLENY